MAVTSEQYLGRRPVTSWIEDLPANAWQRFSAGDGAKGPRLYDWARVPYGGAAEGFRHALLVRRSLAQPHELTFSLTHAPAATTPAALGRVAGTRWSIESLFEQAKGEVGLDQYEVRSWVGWHRHSTLASSHSPLSPPSATRRPGGADPMNLAAELLPLTVPEIRHLLWALVGPNSPQPRAVRRWSGWRRKHQQRARRAHWHSRTQR